LEGVAIYLPDNPRRGETCPPRCALSCCCDESHWEEVHPSCAASTRRATRPGEGLARLEGIRGQGLEQDPIQEPAPALALRDRVRLPEGAAICLPDNPRQAGPPLDALLSLRACRAFETQRPGVARARSRRWILSTVGCCRIHAEKLRAPATKSRFRP